MSWTVTESDEDVELHFHGKTIALPLPARPALAVLTGVEGHVTAGDLDELLNPESAVRLTRRLVQEGFLTLCGSRPEDLGEARREGA